MSLSDDYRAIHDNAALGALQPRRQIAVAGSERATYLQGLLTNDITALQAGSGCYAAWLTPQGRMVTDLHVLESGDLILLDVPEAQHVATLEQLDRFLFSEDVQLASLDDDLTGVWIHGPAAATVIERVVNVTGLGGWRDYQLTRSAFGEAPVVVARIDQLGVPGFCVYVAPASRSSLEAALEGAGAVRVSHDALEAARIEAGYPLFGIDMTSDTIPLEAGLETRAISTTKGCYVGQEVIIRVLHRGHGRVAKKLVGLRSKDVVTPGNRIIAAGKDIGVVTSATLSPEHGPVALGYVHRDFVEPGTEVNVQHDGAAVRATVTSRPR
jgi:folate-binding protein YgfZ